MNLKYVLDILEWYFFSVHSRENTSLGVPGDTIVATFRFKDNDEGSWMGNVTKNVIICKWTVSVFVKVLARIVTLISFKDMFENSLKFKDIDL